MIRPRKKLRRGELTPMEKAALRLTVYEESEGKCQLKVAPNHVGHILPLDADDPRWGWHLVHIKAKRRFGWGRENLVGGCFACHSWLHQGGKPVKAKEQTV